MRIHTWKEKQPILFSYSFTLSVNEMFSNWIAHDKIGIQNIP